MADSNSTPIGARFNKLVAIGESYRRDNYRLYARFRCDCGVEKEIQCYLVAVGKTMSCGCHRRTMKRAGNVTHGKSRTPAWRSYHAMMTRCYNERQRTYQQYGGRGITVCDRWRAGFEFFYADMGDRPDGMTLDRLDVNAGYSPSNCRWATDDEQVNNKQDSVILEWQGERLNVAQWSAKTGISRGAIETRIKLGWDIEKTLTIPAVLGRNQFGEGGVPVEFNGEVKTWMQWSESTGIAYATLKKRIEAGWSVERALSTPLLVVRRKR